MLKFISDILYIPWQGAKVITKIIITSSVIIGSGIFFTAPAVRFINNNVIVNTQLKNSYTKEIHNLLKGATSITINYQIKLNTSDNQLYVKNIFKEINYDIFNKEYRIYNSDKKSEIILKKKKEVKKKFEYFSYNICNKKQLVKYKILKVKIKATISIKEKETELINMNLWKNEKPVISFEIKADKNNGN